MEEIIVNFYRGQAIFYFVRSFASMLKSLRIMAGLCGREDIYLVNEGEDTDITKTRKNNISKI